MPATAFLPPLLPRAALLVAHPASRARRARCAPARPRSRRTWLACANRPDEERVRDDVPPHDLSHRVPDPVDEELEAAAAVAMQEIDQLAEQWIGSNLARWEWYERVKARRERMLRVSKDSDDKFDHELQELKRTFMEIDAVFGTSMIENNEVSAAGWSTVVLIMLLYVVLGYWAFELVVGWLTSIAPQGFP